MEILIAEDDSTSRAVLVAVLEEAGHRITATVNGAAAWEALQKPNAPRFAILDWVMPEMDGLEVVRRVRAIRTGCPPYIIMLSSRGDKADVVTGLAAGANDYVAKPFDPDELCARLEVGRRMVEMQEALRASEERHRTTLMDIGDAVVSTDTQGRVAVLNPVAQALTGWSQADAAGRRLEEVFRIVNEETRAVVENPVARILREGIVVGLANHTILIAKDGVERPIADSGAPIRSADGTIAGVVLVFRDQTEQRRAEAALIASETRYRRLFETAKDGILILDAQTGEVVDVNPYMIEMLGFSHERFVGKRLWELGFFKDIVANRANFEELQSEQYVRYEDLPLETADGRQIDVEFVSNVYLVDRRKVIQCNIRNITDRKKAEAALRASEANYHVLFETMQEGFAFCKMLFDEHGQPENFVYISVNEAFERLTGLHDVIGKRVTDAIPTIKAMNPELFGIYGRVALSGKPERFEMDFKPLGQWLSVSVHSPEKGFFVSVFQDITGRKKAEEALRESEEKFRNLFDNAQVGMFRSRLDGSEVLDANDKYLSMLGMKREEFVGKPSARIWADRQEREEMVKTLEAQERVAAFECRLLNKAGEERHFLTSLRLYRETGILEGSILDITERKRAEVYQGLSRDVLEILNRSSDFQGSVQSILAAIQRVTGCGAVGMRMQSGDDFPYYSHLGFPDEFLLAENTLLVPDPEGGICRNPDGSVCLECTCGLVISGKADLSLPFFTPGGSFWTNDSMPLLDIPLDQDPRLHPRNRCIHDGYASVALVPIRAARRIVGLLHLNHRLKGQFAPEAIDALESIASHIGEALMRQQAEAALRESEASRDLSLRAAHMGAWQWDIAVNRRSFDEQTCLLLGLNPATFGGEADEFFAVVHPDDRANLEAALARTLAEDVPYVSEYRAVWPDGSIHFISARGRLSRDEAGRPRRIRGIIWDVTENRRTEEEKATLQEQLAQAQKMESVGRLAGGVAHDFNNMLGVILGHAEIALDRVDSALPLHADLQEIRAAAERSADLTRQLLAFARKQTVAPKVLNLNDTVAGMLKMLKRLIGEDIELAWVPGAAVWPVKMDPSQIDQILANLCVNARDAIEDVGKVTIETGNSVFDANYCADHLGFVPGEYVRLVVSDNGCGMDRETLEHIFEPFFTTKAVGEGTGLGLATVYGAVKQNNGFINAYSEPGQGTTFTIYLPRHFGKTVRQLAEGAEGQPERGHETILLVEDERPILKLTTTILKRQGYVVLAANTPGEAIRLATEHSGEIHLLVTDVVMPEMNGRDLAKNLLSLYPHLKRLFMSGYTANVIAHHGVLDSGVHFIQKPFSVKGLSAKVREALEDEG